MTREEYDALLKQREEIKTKFDALSADICMILEGIGLPNDWEAKIYDITNGIARIGYLKRRSHGSCCPDDWDSTEIPAHWIFGGDWKTEHAQRKAEEDRLAAEKEAADTERERQEQERRDKEEFERLKAKFEGA